MLNEVEVLQIRNLLSEGKKINDVARILNLNPVQVALVASQTNRKHETTDPTTVVVRNPEILTNTPESNLTKSPQKASSSHGEIVIGYSGNNDRIVWNPLTAPNPHLMIVGESGFGKTYGITGMICELSKIGLPAIIVDYSRSYEQKNFPHKYKQYFHEINIGENGITLNPLEIRENDVRGPLSVAVRISGTFNRIYQLGVHQSALLRDSIEMVFNRRGIYEHDKATWNLQAPFLSDLENELQRISQDDSDIRQKRAEMTYSHISNFFAYDTFNPSGAKFAWKDVVGSNRIMVLQLSGLDGKTQKVVTEFLLWDIFSYFVSRGQNPLSCFLVLDEAHNLSFKTDTPVDKIVREARKLGLAAILASQQPEDFSGPVFSCTGTKICFQFAEQKGKFIQKIASKCKNNPNTIRDIISTLPKASVFVLSENTGIVCKVASHEQRGLI